MQSLKTIYHMALLISLFPIPSHSSLTTPAITLTNPDSLTTQNGNLPIAFTITDPSGISSYTLFLNGKDCTSKVKVRDETGDRRSLQLSFNAPLREGLNTLIVNATNSEDRQSSRSVIIKKEGQPSWFNYGLLRKALYLFLKRLF